MARGFLFDEGDELILRKESAGGLVVHLSDEAVELTIGDETYQAYPIDRTYKDLTENVSVLLDEGDGYTEVLPMATFSDSSFSFSGYNYVVQFFRQSDSSMLSVYAQSETGTMYAITLNS